MENRDDIDQEKGMKEPFLNHRSKSLGGVRTLPFILANEAFEKAAFIGLQPNMILYLMGVYGLDMATGANIIFLWGAASNFTPTLGAFLADAYVGRFRMIGFGSVLTLLGMILLWSTTVIPGVSPLYKETATTLNSSSSSTNFKLVYLCASLALMSIGSGGVRSSTLAFGADQLSVIEGDEIAKPDKSRTLESFFNWYYFSTVVSVLFATTFIVYIQDHLGWQVGFAIPVLFMLVSVICFFLATAFYVKVTPMASVLTRLAQVAVASWRNRHFQLPSHESAETIYHVIKGSVVEHPTENLRFLNKACVVNDPQQDLTADGMAVDPWRLCTIDQVEDLKAIINTIPLWSTGILFHVSSSTGSFLVIQAKSMDRHFIATNFEIPAASFGTFALISIILWLILYNRFIIPLTSKVKGKNVSIDARTRIGCGLLVTVMYTALSGFVESTRRGNSLAAEDGSSVKPMSAMWLVPQICLIGLAEGLTLIGLVEFFYSEFPRSMSSISSTLVGLSSSVGSLVSSVIVSVVHYVTKQGGKESWLSSDPDKGHYDYYYWVLAGLSLANYTYFLVCSREHREKKRVSQGNEKFTN